jgi:hypothetical protein
MVQNGSFPFLFDASAVPRWSLYTDGHVIAGAIVHCDPTIEAQILLDGKPLYRSRHASRDAAERELIALRGRWAREGWVEASR